MIDQCPLGLVCKKGKREYFCCLHVPDAGHKSASRPSIIIASDESARSPSETGSSCLVIIIALFSLNVAPNVLSILV